MRDPNPIPQRERFPALFKSEHFERNERLLLELQRGSGNDYRALIPSSKVRHVESAAGLRVGLPAVGRAALEVAERIFGSLL